MKNLSMCFLFKNSGKIKRSLQGWPVKNTHKKHMVCSEDGCGHWFGQKQWDFFAKFSVFFEKYENAKIQKCKNTKMHHYHHHHHQYNGIIISAMSSSSVQWHHHHCNGIIISAMASSSVQWHHHHCIGNIIIAMTPSSVQWHHHQCNDTIIIVKFQQKKVTFLERTHLMRFIKGTVWL